MPHMANLPWIFLFLSFTVIFIMLFFSMLIPCPNTFSITSTKINQNKKTKWQW